MRLKDMLRNWNSSLASYSPMKSAMRFEVDNSHGKPAIFWDQGKQPPKTKKFGYKKRELRHPLRGNPREPLPPEVVVHRHDNSKVQHQPLAERTDQTEQKPQKVRPEKDFIRKNRQQFGGKKKAEDEGPKKASDHPMANTVTLTQEQLNAIFASVGKMASGKENALRISIDKESNEIQIASADLKEGGDERDKDGEKGDREKGEETGEKETSDEQKKETEGRLTNRHSIKPKKRDRGKQRRPRDGKTEKDEDKTNPGAEKEKSENRTQTDSEEKVQYESPRVVLKHLTVAEKKRLQWARERAELSGNYDPWGRPGAGAPLRDHTGHVLADYNNRKEDVHNSPEVERRSKQEAVSDKRHKRETTQRGEGKEKGPSEPAPAEKDAECTHTKEEEKKKWLEELDKQREELRQRKQKSKERHSTGPDDTWADRFSTYKPAAIPQQDHLAPPVKDKGPSQSESSSSPRMTNASPQHAAIRSSFNIGNVAPDDKKFSGTKDEEKKKWLEELERQIEEKRMKKMKEKDKEAGTLADTWADRFSYAPPVNQTTQDSYRPPVEPEKGEDNSGRVSSAPQPLSARDMGESTYLRGQNVSVDPLTRQEQEFKRSRYLEHQEALKRQIEEKEREKRMAREKKMMEEMEEEAKMRRQREALENQFNVEQMKTRQKEEARERQVRELKQAMDEAQERAQHEKLLRRMEHLRQGGHDVSHLQAHLDEPELSPSVMSKPGSSPGSISLPAMSPRINKTDSAMVPGLNLGQSHESTTGYLLPEISSRTVDIPNPTQTHQAYTENRVLTPSRYRHPSQPPLSDPTSPSREFGTQTLESELKELSLGLQKEMSEVQIEYKESRPVERSKPPGPVKKVRVKSADQGTKEEVRRGRKKERVERLRPGEKVKWNYQNPKLKQPVKQSERDPSFNRKRQQSEERRAKRAKDLLALVELNKPIIPDDTVGRWSRDPSPGKDNTPRGRQGRSISPERHGGIVPRRQGDSSQSPNRSNERGRQRSPGRHRSLSPHQSVRTNEMLGHSPPVPALKHRREGGRGERAQILKVNDSDGFSNHYETEQYNYSNYQAPNSHRRAQGHYQELNPVEAPVDDGEFIPFTRTTEILDPSRAVDPIQLSRENTQVKRGRKVYTETHNPASYGRQLENIHDKDKHDPLIHPELVKNHPTGRQDRILQQLSTLKQSLMQRRLEIETCMSPSDLEP